MFWTQVMWTQHVRNLNLVVQAGFLGGAALLRRAFIWVFISCLPEDKVEASAVLCPSAVSQAGGLPVTCWHDAALRSCFVPPHLGR